MANVTLYKDGKTMTKSEEGAGYYVNNYGWSLTPPSSSPTPTPSAPTPTTPTPTTPTTPAKDNSQVKVWKNGKSTVVLAWEVPSYLARGYTSNQAPTSPVPPAPTPTPIQTPSAPTPITPTTLPATTPKTTRSLIDIANSRPDVLETAKAQGGDPFTAGTPANTWLNNWWNTAGKNEFPDVILGEPIDEQTQITNEANEVMEEFFDNLPDGDDLEISDSQLLLDEIIERFESGEGAPEKPPSMAELFAETKASLGVEELETELADIYNKIDETDSELLIQAEEAGHGQQLVTTGQLNRRKGSLQREAENRIQRLNIQRGAVARMLNNKISSLNMIMQFSQQDYQNSAAYYKANFDRAIQMYNLISDAEDKEMEIEEKAEQDAKANWTVLYSSIADGYMDYGELTTDQKLQIKDLETQAGLPVGFMDMVMGRDPLGKVQTVTSRTDSAGNTYFDVLKVAPDGTMTVESIFKGKANGSGGYAPSTTKKEWLERGGESGTGMTLNEYFDSKESDGDTTDSDRNNIKSDVDSITGSDRYVNPNKMKELRQDIALNNPELLSWFDEAFQPKDMLNPEHYSYEIGENEWTL